MSPRTSARSQKGSKNPVKVQAKKGSGIKTSTPLRSTDRMPKSASSKKTGAAKIPVKMESPDVEIKTSTPQRSSDRKRGRGSSSKKIDIKAEDLNAMIESSTPLRPPKKVAKSPDSVIEAGTLTSVKRRSGPRRLPLEEGPVATTINTKKGREDKKVIPAF